MLKEVIEDALQRGEKLKKDIVRQVLSSAALNELVVNRRFVETVGRVIETKQAITQILRKNVHEILKVMSIPSQDQIGVYEKRIQRLEHQIDQLGRRLMKKGLARAGNASKKPRRKSS